MQKYLIIINIISFLLMGYDKNQSIHKKNRIPEITILSISYIGGGLGSLLGMIFFHHKTKKLKFKILIPLSILINIFMIIFLR